MDVLFAPVFESFLAERHQCFAHGGFVVGPMGADTAADLFEECCQRGERKPPDAARFVFSPMLAAVVYECRCAAGGGGYRYLGLVDEIEINTSGARYRYELMKPGRGVDGEHADDERMPAFVRFRELVHVSEVFPRFMALPPRWGGLPTPPLRRFGFGEIDRTELRVAFDQLRLAFDGRRHPSS